MSANLAWPNRFLGLGESFFTALPAQALPDPHWVATSPDCAALLGLPSDWADAQALQVFSGNATWPGMQPLGKRCERARKKRPQQLDHGERRTGSQRGARAQCIPR